jgi:adenylate cyclase
VRSLTVACGGPILTPDRGVALRYLPNIRFGTERYPEKVARRLRAMNIAAWIAAAQAGFFAILRMLDPAPGMFTRGLTNAGFAAALAALPLLHRFSPLAAPLVFLAIVYALIFRTSYQIGTGGGSYMFYLTATALIVLLIGTEYVMLSALVAAMGAVQIIVLHLVAPYNTGLVSPEFQFWTNFVASAVINTVVLFTVMFYAFRQVARAEATAEREYERSEGLLLNILPPKVAKRLKDRPGTIADAYPAASILFTDMAGFTARASDTTPEELVEFLNGVYTRLDSLVERHGLEKIKTTGDAYMVVSGVPEPLADHAAPLAALALDIRDVLAGLTDPKGRPVPVRIGIASGPVVAGVVGSRKFFYDVWGDAVNTASRMESTGEAGKIQVAPATRELLGERFVFEERGVVEVRGKGPMRTWWLLGKREEGPIPKQGLNSTKVTL